MAARERLPPWHEHHRLANGREVLIRPIRPEDAEPLRAGFALLEPESLRARLAGGRDLGTADAGRVARPNPRTEFTLVTTDLEGPGEAVIAAVAHVRTDPAAHEGAFILLVSRFITGLGMRRYLLTRIVKWARSRRLGLLRGELPRDPALLDLASSLGFQLDDATTDAALVQVSLTLPAR
ncbi:acyl-CoA synthetase [Lysobacter xinjiangensis]|jgi:GNAT superfamily N-acetyltransferase|uniref:Acyl-CoA synthetase n=1 Tax=Cognatilysobacter xinjiangensis TaxID=546892 RepID=A0ABQ3BZS4_9GAMM|nr:N-acetyltransferase [Lysobacter xinjiangensis]GGZ61920.1 acyl-CoA synthetase [Lysobacter xinjiangensis]